MRMSRLPAVATTLRATHFGHPAETAFEHGQIRPKEGPELNQRLRDADEDHKLACRNARQGCAFVSGGVSDGFGMVSSLKPAR